MTTPHEERLRKLKENIEQTIIRRTHMIETYTTIYNRDGFTYSFAIENLDYDERWAFTTLPDDLRNTLLNEWGMTYDNNLYSPQLEWDNDSVTIPELKTDSQQQYHTMLNTVKEAIEAELADAPHVAFSTEVVIKSHTMTPRTDVSFRVLRDLQQQYPKFDISVIDLTQSSYYDSSDILFHIKGIKPHVTIDDVHRYLLHRVELVNAYGYRKLTLADHLPKNYLESLTADERQQLRSYFDNLQSYHLWETQQSTNGLDFQWYTNYDRVMEWDKTCISWNKAAHPTPQKERLEEKYLAGIEAYAETVLEAFITKREEAVTDDPTDIAYLLRIDVPNQLVDNPQEISTLPLTIGAESHLEKKLLAHDFRDIVLDLRGDTLHARATYLPLAASS